MKRICIFYILLIRPNGRKSSYEEKRCITVSHVELNVAKDIDTLDMSHSFSVRVLLKYDFFKVVSIFPISLKHKFRNVLHVIPLTAVIMPRYIIIHISVGIYLLRKVND